MICAPPRQFARSSNPQARLDAITNGALAMSFSFVRPSQPGSSPARTSPSGTSPCIMIHTLRHPSDEITANAATARPAHGPQ